MYAINNIAIIGDMLFMENEFGDSSFVEIRPSLTIKREDKKLYIDGTMYSTVDVNVIDTLVYDLQDYYAAKAL